MIIQKVIDFHWKQVTAYDLPISRVRRLKFSFKVTNKTDNGKVKVSVDYVEELVMKRKKIN